MDVQLESLLELVHPLHYIMHFVLCIKCITLSLGLIEHEEEELISDVQDEVLD